MPRTSPTVRLRRLSQDLKRLREQAGLSVTNAARQAGWTPSVLSNAEHRQWRRPNVHAVARLLDVYGVTQDTQPDLRTYLLRLAKDAGRRGWWSDYNVRDDLTTYVGLEAGASNVRNWEPVVVPGLLQTADYAGALIRDQAPWLSDEEVEDRVDLRMERQANAFSEPEPVQLWAILGEATLHSLIGGTKVMAEQVEHLHQVAQSTNVTVQILPFAAGAPVSASPFAALTFAGPMDPECVYIESSARDLWIEAPKEVATYQVLFEQAIPKALTVPDTLRLLLGRAEQLRKGET